MPQSVAPLKILDLCIYAASSSLSLLSSYFSRVFNAFATPSNQPKYLTPSKSRASGELQAVDNAGSTVDAPSLIGDSLG